MGNPERVPQPEPDTSNTERVKNLLQRSDENHADASKNRLWAWVFIAGGAVSAVVDGAQLTTGSSWEKEGFGFMLDAAALGAGFYNARQMRLNQQRSREFLDWAKEAGAGPDPLALPGGDLPSPAHYAPPDHTQLTVIVAEILDGLLSDKGVDVEVLKNRPQSLPPGSAEPQ